MSIIGEGWLNETGYAMGLGINQYVLAGLLLSAILSAVVLFAISIASSGNVILGTIGVVLCLVIFTAIGWINYFLLILIIVLVSAMWAGRIREGMAGGGAIEEH